MEGIKLSQISVIVPVYNGEKYIEKCINMILNQTFKEFELILINDGSTDNSLNIMKRYALLDNRIKLIDKINSGVSETRNKGIELASSPYLMFIDCDDIFDDTWFESMYNAIQQKNTDLIICGHIDMLIYQNIKIKEYKVLIDLEKTLSREEFMDNIVDFRKKGILDTLWNKIYKTNIIKENNIRFVSLELGEDTLFNLDYYGYIKNCFILNEAHYKYRIELENLSWKKYSEKYYYLVEKEYVLFNEKLKEYNIFDIYAREFQANRLILGFINQIKNLLSHKSKDFEVIISIKKIMERDSVQEALVYSKFSGKFHKLFVYFLRKNQIFIALYLIKVRLLLVNFINHLCLNILKVRNYFNS